MAFLLLPLFLRAFNVGFRHSEKTPREIRESFHRRITGDFDLHMVNPEWLS
jgi:hypothetical protein